MSLVQELRKRNILFGTSPSDQNEITVCCPFCVKRGYSQDTRFRLGINLRSSKGHCFNCDWKSRHAIEQLARALQIGDLITDDFVSEEKKEEFEVKLPADYVKLWRDNKRPFGDLYKQAFDYLINRGVTTSQIETHRIGVSLTGEFAYRIIFPVYYEKKLLGIVARDFTGGAKIKYKNSIGPKYLYGLKPPIGRSEKAILCEGVFDKLALERAFPDYDVIGLLGHSLPPDMETLLNSYEELVFWCDPDLVGVKGFLGIAERYRTIGKHSFLVLPHLSKDAGDMTVGELQKRKIKNIYPWTPMLAIKMRNEQQRRILCA